MSSPPNVTPAHITSPLPTLRRPRKHHIPLLQRHDLINITQQPRYPKEHQSGIITLPYLMIHPQRLLTSYGCCTILAVGIMFQMGQKLSFPFAILLVSLYSWFNPGREIDAFGVCCTPSSALFLYSNGGRTMDILLRPAPPARSPSSDLQTPGPSPVLA